MILTLKFIFNIMPDNDEGRVRLGPLGTSTAHGDMVMAKALVVFGSTTGNTESVAEYVGKTLEDAGMVVVVKNASNVTAAGMADGFDSGAPGQLHLGDDDVELQEDFQPLYENLEQANLSGKKVAVFGCGIPATPIFAGRGCHRREGGAAWADVVAAPLKNRRQPGKDEAVAWAREVVKNAA